MHTQQNVDDVDFGVFCFKTGGFVVNHMEHLILNQFICQHLDLSLLLQKFVINFIVVFAYNQISPRKFPDQIVSLVEILDDDL